MGVVAPKRLITISRFKYKPLCYIIFNRKPRYCCGMLFGTKLCVYIFILPINEQKKKKGPSKELTLAFFFKIVCCSFLLSSSQLLNMMS